MTFRNRDIGRKNLGASVGSRNLANYIGRDRKGRIKEQELNRFVERVVSITTTNRSSVVKLFKTLIAYIMEVYEESQWTLSNVSELGTLYSYEEIKASITDLEKDEGRTVAVKMFEVYQNTQGAEKNYGIVTKEIARLVKQYLLREI